MDFKTISLQELCDMVPKSWLYQYRNWGNDSEKMAILAKLNALTKPLKKDEIDAIIGNGSWTQMDCSHCGTDGHEKLAFLKDTDEYGDPTYCEACLRGALDALLGGV